MSVAYSTEFDADATSIRTVVRDNTGKRIVMAGFPGLSISFDGSGYIDPEALGLTLETLTALGVRTLVVHAEEHELPEGAFDDLKGVAKNLDLTLIFFPIEDFSVPGDEALRHWATLGPALHQILDTGQTLAVSCQLGAGRSGLMAALLLIERGLEPNEAIALIRRHYSKAIENKKQENWLIGQGKSVTV